MLVDILLFDFMKFCCKFGVFYIDMVVELWLRFYFDDSVKLVDWINYVLCEIVCKEKKKYLGGLMVVFCCGVNLGMVFWFVK